MNFSQFLLVLKARKAIILLSLLLTVSVTMAVTLLLPPAYTASTSLVIDFKGVDALTGAPLPAQLMPGYMATQAGIIGSHNVALKVVNALKLADKPIAQEQFKDATHGKGSIHDWMADVLLDHLKVEPSKEGSMVELSFTGSEPRFAAAIANAFARAYITTNLELKVEPSKQISAWFDGQIQVLREKLESAQARVSAYQREKGIVSVDERLDVENARLAEISAQLVLAQSQTYDSLSRKRQMNEAGDGRAAEALPEVIGSPLIQGMKADLARAESKLADVSSHVGANHPEYRRLLAEVESLRRKLDTEVRNTSAGIATTARIYQQREAQLKNALSAQKAKILKLTQQRDEFAVLMRELESAQKMLEAALQRAGQTRLESMVNQTNIAVLNPATAPVEHSSPKILRNFILAFFFGILLGIAVGFVREMADRRIRSEQDVADCLGVPVLGVLSDSPARNAANFMRFLARRPAPA